jgi:putative intracellular protease/amidase
MRVLVVASNYGVWAEELQAPWDALREAGHQLTLATPQGKKPLPLAISVDPDFVDPVQKYHVNPPEVCARVKDLVAGTEWNSPVRLRDVSMRDFDAIVMAGGLGADLDLANNPALHSRILEGVAQNKLVAAMCFAVAALVFARDPATHKSVVHGKKITAHPRDWDFKDDVSYVLYQATPDNRGTDVVTPGFVLPLQDLATDAVGPTGHCFSDPSTSRSKPSVVFDWPFITACSVESAIAYGTMIVDVLAKGARAKASV